MATDDTKPYRYQKGTSGNPKGGSRKASERAAFKSRLAQIRRATRKPLGDFDDKLASFVIAEAANLTAEELTALLQTNLTPHIAKHAIKEATQDPRMAFELIKHAYIMAGDPGISGDDGKKAEAIRTSEEAAELLERAAELIREEPKQEPQQ